MIAEGFSASNLARTVARWEKDADFNELLVKGVRTSLATEAPALLKHALDLATTSKSQFVQAEMTKWLLERAGLVPPRSPTEQAVLRAGSLTLNILPPDTPRVSASRVSPPRADERPGVILQADE